MFKSVLIANAISQLNIDLVTSLKKISKEEEKKIREIAQASSPLVSSVFYVFATVLKSSPLVSSVFWSLSHSFRV